jgi:hypothetical protein
MVLACVLVALSACRVSKDGTGYLGDAGRRDGGEAGTQPPNLARADGGDLAPARDVVPGLDVVSADGPTTPDTPPINPPPDVAPPDLTPPPPVDMGPPPACQPNDRRCMGKIPESCVGGSWVRGEACPFICAGGLCSGVCTPRSVICMGSKRRTCRADASGYEDMDCPAPPGGTATCNDATCGFECTDPNRRFRCGNACCACMKHEDCPAKNVCTAGACKYQAPVIHITGGFYGRNCQGMGFPPMPPDARPDRTAHLAQACEGKTSCEYDVDHTVIGDPASGCFKIYEATWQCVSGATRTMHMATVPAEASFRPPLKIACAP